MNSDLLEDLELAMDMGKIADEANKTGNDNLVVHQLSALEFLWREVIENSEGCRLQLAKKR